jgi:hypothetical protein
MSPLLLGAAWILFVISCFASMVPAEVTSSLKSKQGGRDEETT